MPTTANYRRQAETCLSLALSSADPVVAEKLKTLACDLMAKSLHPKEKAVEVLNKVTYGTDAPRLAPKP